MSKKNRFYDDFEDEDLVLDKKTKRRLERAAREREAQLKKNEEQCAIQEDPEDVAQNERMSQIALFCQENRWREALLLGKEAVVEALAAGNDDAAQGLIGALDKIEMSMRRQIAVGLVNRAKEFLKKEYHLDVCE